MSEPSPRVLSRHVYLQLKAATRALIDGAGGLAGCEALGLRVRKSTLSDYGSINHLNLFAPVDTVADLEASVGEPFVTRMLARLSGYELFRLPKPDENVNWVQLLGEASQDTSAVIGKLAKALGNDGKVTAKEVRDLDLLSLVDEALRELVRMRCAAAAALDEHDRTRGT